MKQVTDVGQRLLSEAQDWPESWRTEKADVQIGIGILNTVTPFLQTLVASGLSQTTLRRHFSNIWLLGGEIIRQSSDDHILRSLSGFDLVMYFVGQNGGPLSLHNATESEQRGFDSSCRKLYHFLFTKAPKNKMNSPPGSLTNRSTRTL